MSQTKIGVGMIDASSIGDAKLLQGDGSWVTPSSGFEALIGSTVISNDATISFTVDTTYDVYKFVIVDCVPATDDVEFQMRFGDSGGIDSGASDYAWFQGGARAGSEVLGSHAGGDQAKDNAAASMVLALDLTADGHTDVGSAVGEGVNFIIHVFANETSGGTMNTTYNGMGTWFNGSGELYTAHVGGCRHTPLVLTTVQFLFSSGNLSTGRITCFGLKHAS